MSTVWRRAIGVRLLPAGVALLLAACGGANPGSGGVQAPTATPGAGFQSIPARTAPGGMPAGSGVTGTVLLGPMCPVQSAARSCPDRPVSADVVVRDRTGTEIGRSTSDASGRFSLTVPPGAYVVVAERAGEGPGARSPGQAVTVVTGRTTEVVLAVDSGIR